MLWAAMATWKKTAVLWFGLFILALAVGCASDAGPAFRRPGPSADTGPISGSTTGGDAAGTLNLPKAAHGATKGSIEQGVPNPGH